MAPEGVYIVGWKSVAAELGVSVRTAQRWERAAGLPVRRIGPRRGTVQARQDELERWRELHGEARQAALPSRRPPTAIRVVTPTRAVAMTGGRASMYRRALDALRAAAHAAVVLAFVRQDG